MSPMVSIPKKNSTELNFDEKKTQKREKQTNKIKKLYRE